MTSKTRTLKNKALNLFEAEVTSPETYEHFKSLLPNSPNLCKGKTKTNKKSYKVHIATHSNYDTLIKNNHYKLIYIHNNREVLAYISVKKYKKDGGFLFIHKLCSSQSGLGTYLMNKILDHARKNFEKLGITYISLTTHNMDLVGYYNKFAPTFTHIVSRPGSKAKNVPKVAYMIWKLSEAMPNYSYS